jgi:hypothetical protein
MLKLLMRRFRLLFKKFYLLLIKISNCVIFKGNHVMKTIFISAILLAISK